MLPLERRNWIESQILANGKVEIEDLSNELNVSSMTIRRDLAELERLGKAIRTHGGAISPDSLIREVPYSSKESRNINQKKVIAKNALPLIPKNANIILDSGTTTLELAKLLKSRNDITVITNDIKIAVELMDSELKVIVAGGELQTNVGALSGWPTQEFFKKIHVDLFFMGVHAIDLKAGITSPSFEKSLIKKLMLDSAAATWALIDSSKFNKKSFSTVCPITSLEGIITDDGLDLDIREEYEEYVAINYCGGEHN
ncbi:DeoR/GlpR family DNA-binding transcription regulator [Siminovitchia fortis]|uniref:DeoR/GlpR family DNA-binding transcription regulator n=1 Tax=Siminovitchia fortis TaxID=254758 RepID=UPI0011A67E3F|nr:DeoR/GlpR family DNA-binding transcription regulator [Siminovitchia fortis]